MGTNVRCENRTLRDFVDPVINYDWMIAMKQLSNNPNYNNKGRGAHVLVGSCTRWQMSGGQMSGTRASLIRGVDTHQKILFIYKLRIKLLSMITFNTLSARVLWPCNNFYCTYFVICDSFVLLFMYCFVTAIRLSRRKCELKLLWTLNFEDFKHETFAPSVGSYIVRCEYI